jgi:hypothetical protein
LIVGSFNLIIGLMDSIVGSINSIDFSTVPVEVVRLAWIAASGVARLIVLSMLMLSLTSWLLFLNQGHQKQTLSSMVNCCTIILSYRGDMMLVDWVPNRGEEDLSIDVSTVNRVKKMVLIGDAEASYQLFDDFVLVV